MPPQPAPPNPNQRAANKDAITQAGIQKAEAAKLEEARKAGAVIKDGKLVPHPDGKGGMLHQAGFALPTFRDGGQGATIPYRDDHGRQHEISPQDIRRVTGPDGKTNYHFMVGGKNVTVAEDSKAPLFHVDAKGMRYTQAADGSQRQLGYDPNAAAQAAVSPREAAAQKAREQKLAEGEALTRALDEKRQQAAAAQLRLDTALKNRDDISKNGRDSNGSTDLGAAQQELLTAFLANDPLQQEVQKLQTQHDEHYARFIHENRARSAETGWIKSNAAASPTDEPWQKDLRSLEGDTRTTDLRLRADLEKTDPAKAEAMRQHLTPAPARRLNAALDKAFGPSTGPDGQPAAPGAGNTMTLQDVLGKAPAMTQGKDWRQKTVDQTAAGLSTSENALGIPDPQNVHVSRSADCSYALTRPDPVGGGAGGPAQPFATLDAKNNRITLVPGPDGQFSPAALDMIAKGSPHGMPIYVPGGQPPFNATEISDLISKGQQAASSATDRAQADAALTQAGLSPEGIGQMVREGRLSVQDGKFLNDKFNSGASSYAARQAQETAQKNEAGMQQLYEDSKGTAEKPSFRSWMDKGDPKRDAQVQARAKELGVSEDAVRRDLEARRFMDWSTPLTQESHDKQTGFFHGLGRKLGLADMPEPTRTLPDGTIMPNPELGSDRAKFDAAIASAGGTPEAKEKARALWDKYHDNYITNVRPSLEKMPKLPGVENYTAWRERMQDEGKIGHLTENQKAEKYMEEQKGRNGFVKFLDNVGSNLLAGSHDLVAGIVGTAGMLTGSQTLSEFAAEKSDQAGNTTAALQYTGNDGLVSNVIGGLARAAPGLAATAATGGALGTASKAVGLLGNGARVTQVANALNTAANSAKVARAVNAATAFTQTAGTTYADLYQHHIKEGLTHEDASKKAAGAAAASGAFSAALGGVFSGGKQALVDPTTRAAARQGFGTVMKTFLKGAADEVPEELLDSGFNTIMTEVNKGKSLKEATASFIEQLPETLATAGVMGGSTEAGAHLLKKSDNPAAPPAPGQQQQTPIPTPAASTPGSAPASDSQATAPASQTPDKPLQTSVNNSKPQTSPPPSVPTRAETADAHQTVEKLKSQKEPLSPEQQKQLTAAEKTVAQKTEANILEQKAKLEAAGKELHPTAAKALEDAQTKLAPDRPAPPTSESSPPENTVNQPSPASSSPQIPETTIQTPDTGKTADSGTPGLSQSSKSEAGSPASPTPVPTRGEVVDAQTKIDKLKEQKKPLSPSQQKDLDTAEKTVARKTEANLLDQKTAIEARGGKLHDTAAKALADAQAKLAPKDPASPPRSTDSTPPSDAGPDTSARIEIPSRDPANSTLPRKPTGESPSPDDSPQGTDTEAEAPRNSRPSSEAPSPGTQQDSIPPTDTSVPENNTNPPPSANSSNAPQPTVRTSTPPHNSAQSQRPVAPNEQRHDVPEYLSMADSFNVAPKAGRAADPGKADTYRADSGTPAFSQGSPFPGPIHSKTHAERQAENLHLLTTRPRRRSPFSNNVRVAVQGVHGQALRKAAILIDHAHDDGDTTALIMRDKINKANILGNYQDGVANVRPDGPHPLMTSFHETGHHIAMTMLDDAALERVRDAARDSYTWSELYKLKEKDPDFDLNYYTDPHEVFARAYAQTIAMRTHDVEALSELRWVLKHPQSYFKQWPATQFARLQKAVEAELHKIGWL